MYHFFKYAVSLKSYPTGLCVVVIQATSVTFCWDKFEVAAGVTATVTGYQYRLYPYQAYHSFSVGMVLENENTQVALGYLKPDSTYEFSLAAMINNTVGEFAPRYKFRTCSSE